MAFYIKERCLAYTEPLWYLTVAAYGSSTMAICDMLEDANPRDLPGAFLALLRIVIRSPSDLFSIAKLKDAIFGEFWLNMGMSRIIHFVSATIERQLLEHTHGSRHRTMPKRNGKTVSDARGGCASHRESNHLFTHMTELEQMLTSICVSGT